MISHRAFENRRLLEDLSASLRSQAELRDWAEERERHHAREWDRVLSGARQYKQLGRTMRAAREKLERERERLQSEIKAKNEVIEALSKFIEPAGSPVRAATLR